MQGHPLEAAPRWQPRWQRKEGFQPPYFNDDVLGAASNGHLCTGTSGIGYEAAALPVNEEEFSPLLPLMVLRL